jgi:hypothetical protein
MICFDNDPAIVSYQYEPFSILYEQNKRYIPDFLITYIDGNKKLIETKGVQFIKEKSTEQKTIAALKYCKENNYNYSIFTAKEIKEYETKLGILFSLSELKKELGRS